MKRILSLILAWLLVISMVPLFSFNVFAVWTAPTLGLSTLINLAGNTVTATVTISDYVGLGSLDFKLGYNTAKVAYKNHTRNDILTGTYATINNVSASGYVSVGWSTDDIGAGNSGSAATILVVTFDVVSGQSGTTAFSLTDCSFNDYTGENEIIGSPVPSSVIIPEAITDINVDLAIPVKGKTPVRVVSGTGWTGTVEWTPDIFKFAGGTVYKADVTLTPAVHYKFSSSSVVKLNNIITPASISATEITFSKTFQATADEDLAISNQILGGSLKVGDVYTATINTTGGTGAKIFTITAGTLPAGLGLTSATGVISGTPTVYNVSPTNITVRVKDTVNTLGVTAVITVPAVDKDDPTFTALPARTAVYGDILSTVTLPAGYAWIDGSVSVGNVGTNFFPAKYNLDPGNNADATGNIYVTVAARTLTVTGATATNKKYNNTNVVTITAVTVGGKISGDDVSVNISGVGGTVSAVSPGTYTSVNLTGITLTGSKAGNYTIAAAATGVPASVTVSKADAPTISVQERSFTHTAATSGNTFDIKPLLPSDRGTTTYGTPASEGVYTKNLSVSTAGVLTFGTAAAASAVSENITVTVTMQNYSNSTVTVKVSLVNQIVLTGTPTVTGTLTYGQKLSNLNITVIMKDGATEVPGVIVWDNPNFIPNVGAPAQTWTFTPTDNNTYAIKKGNSAITVSKATPTITLLNKSSAYTGSIIEINTAVVVLVNNETYTGIITYNYYTDLACTVLTATTSGAVNAGSAPIKSGTYYCKASIIATGNYNAASSNVATLTINAPAYFIVSTTAGTGGKITPKQTNVAPGGNVTLTITPDYGYKTAYVKIDNVLVEIKSIYKLENISQDHTVTVTFQKTAVTNEEPFDFIDVTPDAWYYDSIQFVFNKGLMKGVSSELFDPQGTMTRAMLVTVLWRMDGSPVMNKGNNPFFDVASGQWYTNAVLWAYENDIVYGYDSDTFGPGDFINREQLMTIFYRYSSYKEYDMTATDNLIKYKDVGDVSDWALDAMRWAVGMKLITGMTSTTISPSEYATRAQVATILTRYV